MTQYNCNHLYVLCGLFQWYGNTTCHKTINIIPYRSLTGQNPQVSISSLPIDQDILHNLFTEAALLEQFGMQSDLCLCDAVLPPSGSSTKNNVSDCNEVDDSPVLDGGGRLGLSSAGNFCSIHDASISELGNEVVALKE